MADSLVDLLDADAKDAWEFFDKLAGIYAAELRRLARAAVKPLHRAQWSRALVAAGGPADWTLPDPDELLNVAVAAGALEGKTRRLREQIAETAIGGTLAAYGLSFDLKNPLIQNAITQMGQHITRIIEAQRSEIMDSLQRSWDEGLSIRDASKQMIRESVISSRVRGDMIARTELTAATNGGSLAAVRMVNDASPQDTRLTKIWIATNDERTRDSHAQASDDYGEGFGIPVDQPFNVGGFDLQHPGDPTGPPEEVINCRCAIGYEQAGGGVATAAPPEEPITEPIPEPEPVAPIAEPLPGNVAYHVVSREDISEPLGAHRTATRGTGHFGTGTYITSNLEDATRLARGAREIQRVDLTGIHFLKVRNAREGFALHDTLRDINDLATNTKPLDGAVMDLRLQGMAIDLRGYGADVAANDIRAAVQSARDDLATGLIDTDQAGTRLLRDAGFDGVDVRGIPELDNTQYGTVIFRPQTELRVLPPAPERTAADMARELIGTASRAEPKVTTDLQTIVRANGGEMGGLEYRLKTEQSLAGKLERKAAEKGITPAEYSNSVADVLRYTGVFESDGYAAGVRSTIRALRKEGYTINDADVENYWRTGTEYNGINATAITPDGYRFELQFHTPESLDLKNGPLHKLYEQFRDQTDPRERLRLWNEMVSLSERIPQPDEAVLRIGTRTEHPAPRVTPETLARSLVRDAKVQEPQVTNDLESIVRANGGELGGLEHRVKTDASLAGKLDRKATEKGITPSEYADSVADVLRYTGVFQPEDYAAGVERTIDRMRKAGYQVDDADIENYWASGDDYNGINMTMRTRDGYRFELQFHTPESFDLKNGDLHKLYEQFRDETNPHERLRLWNRMVELSNSVTQPSGDVLRIGRRVVHPAPTLPTAPEDLARSLIESAERRDPQVTSDLQAAILGHGGELGGLEYRVKSLDSLVRKLTTKGPLDPVTYSTQVADVLRYTGVFSDAEYAVGVQDAINALRYRGYKIEESDIENYWQLGDDYNGINLNVTTPGGYKFELQFHTPESFALKNGELHRLYEEYRVSTDPFIRRQLWDQMVNLSDDLSMFATHRYEAVLKIGRLTRHESPMAIGPDETLAAAHRDATIDQAKYQGELVDLGYYTGSGYDDMNAFLRHNTVGKDGYNIADLKAGKAPYTYEDYKSEIDVLQRRVDSIESLMLPMKKTAQLYRGYKKAVLDKHVTGGDLTKLIGKTIEDPGFASTTADREIAENFAQHGAGGASRSAAESVVMELAVPKGYPALAVERDPFGGTMMGEAEVILPPGTRYRVQSVRRDLAGRWVVRAIVEPR